jgi:hypothetical protein
VEETASSPAADYELAALALRVSAQGLRATRGSSRAEALAEAWDVAFDRDTLKGSLLEPFFEPQSAKVRALPRLLALIHRDFLTDRTGNSIEHLMNPPFAAGPDWTRRPFTQRCEARRLLGRECPFNSVQDPELQESIEADHLWPHALGGPSVGSNRLWLCRVHNGMKAASVDHFHWAEYPRWLDGYLKCLRSLRASLEPRGGD